VHWLQLCLAILSETLATSALKASTGFTRLVPSLACIVGYVCSFYLLSLALRTIPVGVAYAIWAGAGVALISMVGVLVYEQTMGATAWFGIALIVIGVVVLNLASSGGGH